MAKNVKIQLKKKEKELVRKSDSGVSKRIDQIKQKKDKKESMYKWI